MGRFSMLWTAGAVAAVCGGALAVMGCGSSSTTSAAAVGPPCDTQGSSATTATASYRMVLRVSAVEAMYSDQYASSVHPSSGQLMLGGSMGDASGPNARQIEVHICRIDTGAVARGVNPQIVLADTTTGAAPQTLPGSVMQSVVRGSNDLHYGNDALVTVGHAYTVTVTLNGEKATLPFTAS